MFQFKQFTKCQWQTEYNICIASSQDMNWNIFLKLFEQSFKYFVYISIELGLCCRHFPQNLNFLTHGFANNFHFFLKSGKLWSDTC